MRILIVEDDDALRETLVSALRDRGYAVEQASGGAEAVALAQEIPIDIVVSDIRMEGTDGLTALQEVQKDTPQVQSLVITGYSTEADSIRAIQLGVSDYLKKPFRLPTFLSAVERLVESKRIEKQKLEKEKAWRQTVLWSLENFIQNSSLEKEKSDSLLHHGKLAYQVGCDCGLSYAEAEEVQIAYLLHALTFTVPTLPRFFIDSMTRSIKELLNDLKAQKGDSMGAQICFAVESARRPDEARVGAEIDLVVQASIGRLQELGSLWVAPSFSNRVSDRVNGRRRKSLLALAETLERSGDPQSAKFAYQDILSESSASRESVKAYLALARLENEEGHFDLALEAAGRLGPRLTSETLFAVQEQRLAKGDLVEPEKLQQALSLSKGNRVLTSLLEILLAKSTRSNLEQTVLRHLPVLQQPQNLHHLRASSKWLFPILLELAKSGGGAEIKRALGFLHHDFSEDLEPLLRASEVESELKTNDSSQSSELLSTIRIRSFGTFEVWVGASRIGDKAWKSQKVRYLLAYLALHSRRVVSEDVILELFWPNSRNAKGNLRPALSYIRRYLISDEAKRTLDPVIRAGEGFRLNPELEFWHDVHEVERLEKECENLRQQGQTRESLALTQEIADLCRGPYLEGCYDDWVFPVRQGYERILTKSLMRLSSAAQEMGRTDEALENCLRLLEIDPCHQKVHLAIMKLHLSEGRPEAAIRQYQLAESALEEEFAMEPSAELQRMFAKANES